MRKPLERKNGRYTKRLDDLEDYAREVAKEVCKMYPDIDIIDLRFLFECQLGFEFARRISKEAIDK